MDEDEQSAAEAQQQLEERHRIEDELLARHAVLLEEFEHESTAFHAQFEEWTKVTFRGRRRLRTEVNYGDHCN